MVKKPLDTLSNFLEQWKEIKDNLLKTVSLYKGHSSLREWRSEDRMFFQTLT